MSPELETGLVTIPSQKSREKFDDPTQVPETHHVLG